jgi:peptidyl-prolyl cis-trans isomerase SurA
MSDELVPLGKLILVTYETGEIYPDSSGEAVLFDLYNTLQKKDDVRVALSSEYSKKKKWAKKRLETLMDSIDAKGLTNKVISLEFEKGEDPAIRAELFSTNIQTINQMFPENKSLVLQAEEATIEENLDFTPDFIQWAPGIYSKKEGNGYSIIRIKEVLPAAPKTLKEARGQVLSDYQNYLEEAWIERLKAKYKIDVDEKVLQGLIKN